MLLGILSSHSVALIRFAGHFSCQSSPPYNRGSCLVPHCLCHIHSQQTFNMHLKTDWSFQLHPSPRGQGLTESSLTEVATHDRTIRPTYKYLYYLAALDIKNLHGNICFPVRTYMFSSVAKRYQIQLHGSYLK